MLTVDLGFVLCRRRHHFNFVSVCVEKFIYFFFLVFDMCLTFKFKYCIHWIQHWILIGRFDTRFHCACAMRFLILSAIYNFTITTRSRVLCLMFNAFTTVCLQRFCRIIIILISNHYFDLYESTNPPSFSLFAFKILFLIVDLVERLKSHTNFNTFQADARYSQLTK